MKLTNFFPVFLFALVLTSSLEAGIQGITPAPTVRDSTGCDLMTLRDGTEISVKIQVIEQNTIQYKRCDNLDGPMYHVPKSNVFMIKYPNGRKDVFEQTKPVTPPTNPTVNSNSKANPNVRAQEDGFGILALILVPIALFIPVTLLGVIALGLSFILGVTAPARVRNSDGKLKGPGFGIVAAILAGIILLILLAYLLKL